MDPITSIINQMDFITPIINDMAGETGELIIGNAYILKTHGVSRKFDSIYEINNLSTYKMLDIEFVQCEQLTLSHIIRVLLVYKNIVWIKFRLTDCRSHLFCVRYLRKQRHLLRADIIVQPTSFGLYELYKADQIYCEHFYVPMLHVKFTHANNYSAINNIIHNADCCFYETNGSEHMFEHMKHCISISRVNYSYPHNIRVPRSIIHVVCDSSVINRTYGLNTIMSHCYNESILDVIHKSLSWFNMSKLGFIVGNAMLPYDCGKILESDHHDISIMDRFGTYHFPTAIVKSVEIVSVNNDICKYAINKFL
jgi:hypothetical protein